MPFFRSSSLRTGVTLLLGAIAPGAALAQTSTWAVPGSGFVHDAATRSIRPVAGFIGSATLGSSVLDGVEWASIAPNQKSAILERGRSLEWIADLGAPNQSQALGRISGIRQAFWAADSSRAVTLVRGSRVIWLGNFTANASPTSDVTARLDGLGTGAGDGAPTWTLLAADSSADRVLLALQAGSVYQIWTASRGAAPTQIAFTGVPAAAVFASLTPNTAFLADTAAHAILKISGLDGTPVLSPLATSDQIVGDTAGLVLSTDDTRLFVADRGNGAIHVLDAASGAPLSDLTADSLPRSLTEVTSSRFLINPNDRSVQSLLFLDTAAPARVLFVPRAN